MPRRDRTLLLIETLRCQTRQQYTTLLHQDARLEEDVVNGASVHNLPQVNASVLPATCVGHDLVIVKHVSNSGAIVKPIITAYMHTVSTEVSGMIMNCSRNKLLIRMQLMQSPANGTSSPEPRQTQKYFCLLLRSGSSFNSRALFGREEALRMDEEITDFQWFEHVTWDSIKDLRGTTSVQPLTRFKFALQQAQHAILRAIIHNNLPHWHQSQPGKRSYSAAGSFWTCSQYVHE